MDGERYRDIANAFRYRKEFVADCRCKAEPWTEQARQQHESWALIEEERHDTTEIRHAEAEIGGGEEIGFAN
jgi:hypothetical protein